MAYAARVHRALHTMLGLLGHPIIILAWLIFLIPGLNLLRTPEALLVWLTPLALFGIGLVVDHKLLHQRHTA